jgi:hypothetical protein
MLVIEFQLVESSSMAKTFRAKELCLIESKTATRAVLSECASNESCSVSWMVLRQRFVIPLWRPMQCSKYSIPLEVHHVKKVYGHLANGSVESNQFSVNPK